MKKIFFSLVILFLCFHLISATDTQIEIKTVPNMNVNVLAVSSSFEVYERFNANADQYGDVSFIFSSDISRFGLTIFIKDPQDNSKVAYKNVVNQMAGSAIYLEVVPEGFKIIETPSEKPVVEENQTIKSVSTETLDNLSIGTEAEKANETSTSEETNEEGTKILGWVVFGEDSSLKNIILYIIGLIVLIVIIFFTFKKFRKRKSKIKVKKLSDWMEEKKEIKKESNSKDSKDPESSDEYNRVIEEAQRKIEEAQKEINNLKNKGKIKAAEEKLKRDEQELKELKGE